MELYYKKYAIPKQCKCILLYFIIQEQNLHNLHNLQIFNSVNSVDYANYVFIS